MNTMTVLDALLANADALYLLVSSQEGGGEWILFSMTIIDDRLHVESVYADDDGGVIQMEVDEDLARCECVPVFTPNFSRASN